MKRKAYIADFGAGNTCLYCAKPDTSIREAAPLNTPGGEPSGYAEDRKNKILLGAGLYGSQYRHLEQIDRFRINLKAKPTEDTMDELVFYFKSWLEKMKEDYPEEFEDVDIPYWFIGCPTGGEWKKKETQELYKSIFERAGFENVYIVPESNAALAFYQQTNKILDEYGEGTKLLLFDQGAYSLDAMYFGQGQVTSYGGYLGAALIERMLIHEILYTDEEAIRMKKRMINWPETVEKARELYEQQGVNGKFYTYLLLQARKLKEDYFSALNSGSLVDTVDSFRTLDFDVDGEQLVLFTNTKMMHKILEEVPVRQILGSEFTTLAPEIQEEIGNKTWMQSFRDFLYRVDQEYPDLGDGKNTIIMVTGGGSLMSCVPEAIKAHYKNASVYCDKEAISAIGKGMAYWAPDKIKAIDFEEAFHAFIDREEIDEDGDSVNHINQKLTEAFFNCLKKLVHDITEAETNAVVYGIAQWLDYKCSGNDIPKKIEWYLNDWCKNTGIPSFVSEMNNQIGELKEELNSEFKNQMETFENIDRYELLKKDDEIFLSDCKGLLPIAFEVIIKAIVDHYNGRHDLWNSFPNDKKGLFSDSRRKFYNEIVETLGQWVDKETDATVDLCKDIFIEYEYEFYSDNDIKLTFLEQFQVEARIDLINLMEKHVKEILGKLVLEEYIEE